MEVKPTSIRSDGALVEVVRCRKLFAQIIRNLGATMFRPLELDRRRTRALSTSLRFSKRSRLACVALLLLCACTTSPTGRHQLSLVSEGTAIEASKESYLTQMNELKSAGKLVTDQRVVQRVDRITSRLVAQAVMKRPETSKWDWSIEVIDDPMTVNAWCMA